MPYQYNYTCFRDIALFETLHISCYRVPCKNNYCYRIPCKHNSCYRIPCKHNSCYNTIPCKHNSCYNTIPCKHKLLIFGCQNAFYSIRRPKVNVYEYLNYCSCNLNIYIAVYIMFNDALEILNAESKTHLEKYPLEPNLWLRQSWGSEDCRKLVAEQVASLLEQVQDEGVIRYPSFSFSDNVEYVQGYGLR